ncbi:uncharacterized protein LOC106150615 [Lingula anatina]|uniref:Uncharacterized protein LOC106150615 n=1 Tax=Lingula anatina TaxID=7574 RepID=A0A1S3GYY4_LINAN|nr:uncharacterized protein LOC106150615 [Lingula anatina]|eukprot:XP_013378973.1 uncharacterized protein LOC106150615 [Lingula anatina]
MSTREMFRLVTFLVICGLTAGYQETQDAEPNFDENKRALHLPSSLPLSKVKHAEKVLVKTPHRKVTVEFSGYFGRRNSVGVRKRDILFVIKRVIEERTLKGMKSVTIFDFEKAAKALSKRVVFGDAVYKFVVSIVR